MKPANTPEEQCAWVSRWKDAWQAVEELKSKELSALTNEEACSISDRLLSAITFPRPSRDDEETSGLVEQQRIFAKARRTRQPQ